MLKKILYFIAALVIALLLQQLYAMYSAKSALKNPPLAYVEGPPNADLRATLFIDYTCEYCKDFNPPLMQALAQDGRTALTVVPLGTPEAGNYSAAELLYAAGLQGKLLAMHNALSAHNAPLNNETAAQLIEAIGLDWQATKEILDQQIADLNLLAKNRSLFVKLGHNKVPTLYAGTDYFYLPESEEGDRVQDLLGLFAMARDNP